MVGAGVMAEKERAAGVWRLFALLCHDDLSVATLRLGGARDRHRMAMALGATTMTVRVAEEAEVAPLKRSVGVAGKFEKLEQMECSGLSIARGSSVRAATAAPARRAPPTEMAW